MPATVRHVLVRIAFAGALTVLCGSSSAQSPLGAKALEARLYAPCCYGGTLDIHESDLARALRDEIEARIAQGESSDAIQADFVARYGDEVLAARSDVPIRAMGAALACLAMLSAAALVVVVRRWTRRGRATAPRAAPGAKQKDALDLRIDAELADLDS